MRIEILKKIFAYSVTFDYYYAKIKECIQIMSTILKEKADENLKVAKYSENKELYNSAVSRYYYYIFQNILCFLDSNCPEFNMNKFDQSIFKNQNIFKIKKLERMGRHEYTINYFVDYLLYKKNIVPQFHDRTTISLLEKLRVERNNSDYCRNTFFSKLMFNNHVKVPFDNIEQLLKNINVINSI